MKRTQRRNQLLSKAREVFARKGYHAAKVDDIVGHAEVARGTFYLHFADKRTIFVELVDTFLADLESAIVRIELGAVRSPLDQLRDNIQRVIRLGLSDPCMTKILLEDAIGLDAEFDRKVRAFYLTLENLLQASLEEGQRLGLVVQGDCAVMSALSLGGVKELLLQAAQGRLPTEPNVLTDQVMRFIASGLLSSGAQMGKAPPAAAIDGAAQ